MHLLLHLLVNAANLSKSWPVTDVAVHVHVHRNARLEGVAAHRAPDGARGGGAGCDVRHGGHGDGDGGAPDAGSQVPRALRVPAPRDRRLQGQRAPVRARLLPPAAERGLGLERARARPRRLCAQHNG